MPDGSSRASATVVTPAGGHQGIAVHPVDFQNTRLGIISVIAGRNFLHTLHQFRDGFTTRRLIHYSDVVHHVLGVVQVAALKEFQVRGRVVRGGASGNGCTDVVVPSLVVQEVIAVGHELLVQDLEFRRRFVGVDGVFFLGAAILGSYGGKPPVPQLPVRLDTE